MSVSKWCCFMWSPVPMCPRVTNESPAFDCRVFLPLTPQSPPLPVVHRNHNNRVSQCEAPREGTGVHLTGLHPLIDQ